jgi:hypothetical protein
MIDMKKIICGGCSFTADGIGGTPPSLDNDGGNSFVYDIDHMVTQPRSWASHLAANLAPNSFVNVAANAHGNILTAITIPYLLDTFQYDPSDTLVLFNISDPARFDQMCDHESYYKSEFIPWQEKMIPFAFIDRHSDFLRNIQKHTGTRCVERLTAMWLQFLCKYLKENGFQFAFMTMSNYRDVEAYRWLYDRFEDKFIELDGNGSMKDFCLRRNLTVSEDDLHPNLLGHKLIAHRVLEFLKLS